MGATQRTDRTFVRNEAAFLLFRLQGEVSGLKQM